MKSEKHHLYVGVFGRRNAGKSSVVNLLAGQDVAIVSAMPGTTTDPVRKRMELFGVGAVTLIDTAGVDDEGVLGQLRTAKSRQIVEEIDVAIVVMTDNRISVFEERLMASFREGGIPFFVLHNKADREKATAETRALIMGKYAAPVIDFVALPAADRDVAVRTVGEALQAVLPSSVARRPSLLEGLMQAGDIVLLVTPIDSEAPEGRLILPQVQTIRDVLDNHGVAVVVRETEVAAFLQSASKPPALVVTDSQLFGSIEKMIPRSIPLTGFSILLARYKGDFERYLKGTPAISRLRTGDRVLIMESCTHQNTCEDIGRVKIPTLLRKFIGHPLEIEILPGLSPLPDEVSVYSLVIQCGACMITARQLHNRLRPFIAAGVPVTNYGMAIAYMQGIYDRAVACIL
ncbi:MAG: [FeFe] hydrogenase H-cluster maturation GTPase HydF [Prevotellaceae bacterium]|jgi:[FeFe] hydrogenase H-cluster maturation GTPase HydF|nr:[FeFe] hydrogenase H-cluster maturation GTPase HydF [Prevotellaceae bacterium]